MGSFYAARRTVTPPAPTPAPAPAPAPSGWFVQNNVTPTIQPPPPAASPAIDHSQYYTSAGIPSDQYRPPPGQTDGYGRAWDPAVGYYFPSSRGSGQPTNTTMPVPAPGQAHPAQTPTPAPTGPVRQPTIDEVIAIMRGFPPTNDGFRAGVAAVKSRYPGAAFDLIEHPTRLDKVNLGGGVYDILGAATGTSGTWVSSATPEAFIGPPGVAGSAQGGGGGMAAPAGGGGGDDESTFDALIGNRPPNLASLQAMEPQLRQAGMSLVYNADRTGADVQLPSGEIIDVIRGLTGPSGGESWQWLRPSGAGGGGGGGPVPTGLSRTGSPATTGTVDMSNWQAGIDPSYEFRFGEGVKALQRSAAAKGTLLTGGTLKNLMNYGQQAASQEFGNVFNRNTQLATLGLNATNNAANLGSSYGSQLGNLSGTYSGQLGNLAGTYGNQLGNQSSNFGNQLGNLANNQVTNSTGLTTGQINGLVNLFNQQGNANSQGEISGANSWAGTLANLARIFGPAVIRNP